jgi:CrcB protein
LDPIHAVNRFGLAEPDLECRKRMEYLWIALGGALGSVGRYWVSGVVARSFGETFPWGTLLVNVSGSLAIGFLAGIAQPGGRRFLNPSGRQFFMYGVCGGYTTFSSFSLQTLELLQGGEWFKAGANAVLSVALCLVAAWIGFVAGMAVNPMKGS